MTEEMIVEGTNPELVEAENLTQVEEPEATAAPSEAEKSATQKRIDKLTREKYLARGEAEGIRRENERLRAQLVENSTSSGHIDNDDDAVTRRAEQIVADHKFNDACNKIYDLGIAEFPNFESSIENLKMVGMNRDFLDVVSNMDTGHKILNHLGADLEEAERIASLSPVKMAMELTKLEYELRGKVKKISGAPEPITPVSGVKSSSKSPDKMTDAEFAAWRREQIKAR